MLIGVDIGGSHISAACFETDQDSFFLNNYKESKINTSASSDSIISEWSRLILEVAQGEPFFYVGIAFPGPFDYENGISLISEQGKMKSLYKLSVKELLSNALSIPSSHIHFLNDAEAFLLGESLAGAGKGYSSMLGLTLGTGLGSAIQIEEVVKDAKLWTAPFRDGIAEDYLGTSWFVNYLKNEFGKSIQGARDLFSSEFDPKVRNQVFEVYGQLMGEFIFPYVLRLHSQAVIFGGNIAKSGTYFLPFTANYLRQKGIDIQLKVSELGDKATLIGACSTILNDN